MFITWQQHFFSMNTLNMKGFLLILVNMLVGCLPNASFRNNESDSSTHVCCVSENLLSCRWVNYSHPHFVKGMVSHMRLCSVRWQQMWHIYSKMQIQVRTTKIDWMERKISTWMRSVKAINLKQITARNKSSNALQIMKLWWLVIVMKHFG